MNIKIRQFFKNHRIVRKLESFFLIGIMLAGCLLITPSVASADNSSASPTQSSSSDEASSPSSAGQAAETTAETKQESSDAASESSADQSESSASETQSSETSAESETSVQQKAKASLLGASGTCKVYIDGTNGGITFYAGASTNYQSVTSGSSITLPTVSSMTNPSRYNYVLKGWYDISNNKYYQPGATVTITNDTVFYADWIAGSYSIGQDSNTVSTVDTSSFVTTSLFDYSDLFNVYSLTKAINWTGSGWYNPTYTAAETWTYTTGTADTGTQSKKFLMVDGHQSVKNCIARAASRSTGDNGNQQGTNSNAIGNGTITTGLMDRATDLFKTDGSVIGVNYIGTGNNLFQYDSSSSSSHYGYYYYDSTKNAASYNKNDNSFYVYNYTVNTNAGGDTNGDFLPFNYGTAGTTFDDGNGKQTGSDFANYWFGMKTDINFYLPDDSSSDGSGTKNQAIGGKDMLYEFSGDDDVWVTVDGKLVLDLGGIHDIVKGTINFSTGVVTTWSTANGGSTIEEKTYNFDFKSGDHKLSMYYMERGASQSNCSLYFNLTPRYSLQINKVDADSKAALAGAKFSIYSDANCTIPVQLWDSQSAYSSGADSKNTFTTDSSGKISCYGLRPGMTYYLKEVEAPPKYPSVADKVISLAISSKGTATLGGTGAAVCALTQDASTKKLTLDVTNNKTSIDVTKKWLASDGTTLTEGLPDSIKVQLHRKSVTGTIDSGKTTSTKFTTQYFGTNNGSNEDTSTVTAGDLIQTVPSYTGGKLQFTLSTTSDAGIYSVTANGKTLTPTSQSNKCSQLCLIGGSWQYPYRTQTYTIDPLQENSDVVITLIGYLTYQGSTPLVSKTLTINASATAPTDTSGGTVVDEKVGDPVTLNAGSSWKYSWSSLESVNSSGNPYTYYVTEENGPEGYTTTYKNNDGIDSGSITITNKKVPVTEIPVSKTWSDGAAAHTGDSVTVTLYKNGEKTDKTLTLNSANNWSGKFQNLPKQDADGNTITYSVQETSTFDHYSSQVTGSAADGYKITNTAKPVSLTIYKTDTADSAKKLQGAVFSLYSDSGCTAIVSAYTDEALQNKASSFTTDQNGKIAVYGLSYGTYYIKETKAPDGYYLIKNAMPVKIAIDGTISLPDGADPSHISVSADSLSVVVKDSALYQLPSTGGIGTNLFTISGMALILLSVLLLLKAKGKGDGKRNGSIGGGRQN